MSLIRPLRSAPCIQYLQLSAEPELRPMLARETYVTRASIRRCSVGEFARYEPRSSIFFCVHRPADVVKIIEVYCSFLLIAKSPIHRRSSMARVIASMVGHRAVSAESFIVWAYSLSRNVMMMTITMMIITVLRVIYCVIST
jgi:hypothetical protein